MIPPYALGRNFNQWVLELVCPNAIVGSMENGDESEITAAIITAIVVKAPIFLIVALLLREHP